MQYEMWSAHDLHALADVLGSLPPTGLPVDLLDRLDALERVKSAAAAAQAVITSAFAEAVAVDDARAPLEEERGRAARAMSLGAEVGLAVRVSPHTGEQRLLLSGRLCRDLPQVLDALARGELSEDRAFAVAREVAHLSPAQRAAVDDDLSGRLAGLGDVALRQAVRRSCLRVAAEAEERRHRRARADRHVTTRALDDGTGRLVAILPLEELALARRVLDEAAASARAAGDPRTGGQVRADTVVRCLTGHAPAAPLPTRIDLVIGVESLLGADTDPGAVQGAGWLPAGLCRDLARGASDSARAGLRRLFTAPGSGALVAMESTCRRFDGLLGELLDLRDGGTCRTPWCNAAIRHRDHVQPHADGGPTSERNGQGLCERCNYARQTAGWTSWVHAPPDAGPHAVHEVHGVTEHVRLHASTPPPLPGALGPPPDRRGSPHPLELELRPAPVHHLAVPREPGAGLRQTG